MIPVHLNGTNVSFGVLLLVKGEKYGAISKIIGQKSLD